MTVLGVLCPRGKISFEECKRCSLTADRPCNYSPDILAYMRNHDAGEPGKDAFTPSRLLGCHRQPVLMDGQDSWIDVDNAWSMTRGSIIHAGLEGLKWPGQSTVREQRVTLTVDTKYGPQPFSAKPDVIAFQSPTEFVVWDYKTREVDHTLLRADIKHQLQVNMYAWAYAQATGYVPTGLEIEYIGSGRVRRFSSSGPRTDKGKRHKVDNHFVYDEIVLEPVTLMDMELVGRLVRRLIEKRVEAKEVLPPVLQGDEAKWCFRCPVRNRCQAIEKGENQ